MTPLPLSIPKAAVSCREFCPQWAFCLFTGQVVLCVHIHIHACLLCRHTTIQTTEGCQFSHSVAGQHQSRSAFATQPNRECGGVPYSRTITYFGLARARAGRTHVCFPDLHIPYAQGTWQYSLTMQIFVMLPSWCSQLQTAELAGLPFDENQTRCSWQRSTMQGNHFMFPEHSNLV